MRRIFYDAEHDTIEKDIIKHVIKPVIPANLLDDKTRYLINPTGRFVVGRAFVGRAYWIWDIHIIELSR